MSLEQTQAHKIRILCEERAQAIYERDQCAKKYQALQLLYNQEHLALVGILERVGLTLEMVGVK